VGVAILTETALIFLWLVNFKPSNNHLEKYPSVDILIAARDEEDNIGNCLDSILALNYPEEKLTVWVGDDDSTDNTWKIIHEYASKFSQVSALKITKQITDGNGKANVLAQLAHKCQGDWIFITDADIKVPNDWVKSMLAAAQHEKAELVTGTSLVVGNSWLAKFQRLDWLYATAMLKVVSDFGVPVTTMGNNMAITRKVYKDIGGFESLPFSVTEDLELFKAVVKKHKAINLFSAEVLNESTPQNSIVKLLLQRKRWMRGAFELPIQLLGILLVQAFYLPAIILLTLISPVIGLSFWFIKWILKFAFGVISAKKLSEKVSIFDSFVSKLFTIAFSLASVIYYLWPGKVSWKGRKY